MSVHSATKSAKTWDLIVFRGAKDRPPHEFNGPLGYSTRGLPVLDYFPQGERRHHGHRVGFDVVTQLALCQDYGVDQLLDVGVACLGLGEYFADEVNRSLDG